MHSEIRHFVPTHFKIEKKLLVWDTTRAGYVSESIINRGVAETVTALLPSFGIGLATAVRHAIFAFVSFTTA